MYKINSKSYSSKWIDNLIQEHTTHLDEVRNHRTVLGKIYGQSSNLGHDRLNQPEHDKFDNQPNSDNCFEELYAKTNLKMKNSHSYVKGMN